MLAQAQTRRAGQYLLVHKDLEKWTTMDSDCWRSAPYTSCVSLTFFSRRSLNTKYPGNTLEQKYGIRWDYVITRRETLKDVKLTRSYHCAECDTDHSLVISKIRMSPKRTRRKNNSGKPKLNVENTSNPKLSALDNSSLKTALNLKRPGEMSSPISPY